LDNFLFLVFIELAAHDHKLAKGACDPIYSELLFKIVLHVFTRAHQPVAFLQHRAQARLLCIFLQFFSYFLFIAKHSNNFHSLAECYEGNIRLAGMPLPQSAIGFTSLVDDLGEPDLVHAKPLGGYRHKVWHLLRVELGQVAIRSDLVKVLLLRLGEPVETHVIAQVA
jgi:hypothetical protein